MNRSLEFKKLIALAIPIALTQMLLMSTIVVDNIMVGRLGTKELAAMGVSVTYYTFLFVIAIGILTAINPLISHAHGADEHDKIPNIAHHGIAIGLACALIVWVCILFAPQALRLLGQDPELIALGTTFLTALCWGLPGLMTFIVLRQYADAIGFPTPAMIMMGIAFLLNIFLDWLWIYGNWGFPALGVRGSGYATATVNTFLAAGMLAFSRWHPRFRPYHLWQRPNFDRATFRGILKLGLPMGGSMVTEVGYFCGSTWIAGLIGIVPLAAHQIALNVASFTFMIPLGLSFASAVRIGHFAGAGKKDHARQVGWMGLGVAGVLETANFFILLFFAPQIASIYTQDPETQQIAVMLLRTGAFFQLFDGLQVVGMHSLRGLKDTEIPFLNTIWTYWLVGLPASWGLAFHTSLGVQGIWVGMVLALFCAACAHIYRFHRLSR